MKSVYLFVIQILGQHTIADGYGRRQPNQGGNIMKQ
jgi:hypothetical protein